MEHRGHRRQTARGERKGRERVQLRDEELFNHHRPERRGGRGKKRPEEGQGVSWQTTMTDRQRKKRSSLQIAPNEPEVLKIIGEESRRNSANKPTSRQIDKAIKAYRKTKKQR